MREVIEDLQDDIEVLKSSLRGIQLPPATIRTLHCADVKQKARHARLLKQACDTSEWSKVVRQDLITNLSDRTLSEVQIQALSLGSKFDTGLNRKGALDYVESNYRRDASALERGFIQGLIVCAVASAKGRDPAIPDRYVRALKELRDDRSIMVVPADKGGGLVIINTEDYKSKMDSITYSSCCPGDAEKAAVTFNKTARKILSQSDEGRKMLYLLEENPRVPTMRGTIKTHKPNQPASTPHYEWDRKCPPPPCKEVGASIITMSQFY